MDPEGGAARQSGSRGVTEALMKNAIFCSCELHPLTIWFERSEVGSRNLHFHKCWIFLVQARSGSPLQNSSSVDFFFFYSHFIHSFQLVRKVLKDL